MLWTKTGGPVITLEDVLAPGNMLRAYERVVSNKGKPGVDGMTVDELRAHITKHSASIKAHIRAGTYIPAPVKRRDIPKANGGTRMLGIPTVQDRWIQQSIAQVLTAYFDPSFSEFSYGFREGRSAHQAIEQTQRYIAEGNKFIVEMDLAKFFDTVNHDRLMSHLEKHIHDRMLLKLIRRYLRTGIMDDGLVEEREEGTPQGSPLSPILSLIVLDELDKYLEKRGIKFVRYADDCNLFVKTKVAGERALANTVKFIEEVLKLRVNRDKSGVFRPNRAKFLGYTFVGTNGKPKVHSKSFERLKLKLRKIFYRARGKSLVAVIGELTEVLRGWRNYFKLDTRKDVFRQLDTHIRRHLRKLVWIAWKRPKTREIQLRRRGLSPHQAWKSAWNGRGAWWNAGQSHMNLAFPNWVFRKHGLYELCPD